MQLAQGMRAAGWEVTWFSGWAPGLAREETLDGIKLVRDGSSWNMGWAARRWYRRQPKGYFDFVLDQSHGIPFFAPAWTGVPTMYYIHEVTGVIANYMLPWPLGWFYRWFERLIIWFYRHTPSLTGSKSTADEMRSYGLKAPITVITNGLDVKPLDQLPALETKAKRPTLIFIARLVPLKRPDQAIRTLAALQKKRPDARLNIVGGGDEPYVHRMKRLASDLGVAKNVAFLGRVSAEEKERLLREAHVVLITAIKEGWGLTVTEGNALGTVAVTYNIAGVRDSNLDDKTGVLSKKNTPESLAAAIDDLLDDPKRYARLREAAWRRVKGMTWDKAQAVFLQAVEETIKKYYK